jgi:hypothetical protein
MTAWHTTGSQRPLQERWDEAAAQVLKRGGGPIVPISEESLFRMNHWLERNPAELPAPPPPPSMALRRALDDIARVLDGYSSQISVIIERIAAIKRCKQFAARCTALGIKIDDGLLTPPSPRNELIGRLYGGDGRAEHIKCATTEEAHIVIAQLLSRCRALEGHAERLNKVLWLAAATPELDNIVVALGSRLLAIEGMVKTIADQQHELTEQVKKLKRPANRRAKHG